MQPLSKQSACGPGDRCPRGPQAVGVCYGKRPTGTMSTQAKSWLWLPPLEQPRPPARGLTVFRTTLDAKSWQSWTAGFCHTSRKRRRLFWDWVMVGQNAWDQVPAPASKRSHYSSPSTPKLVKPFLLPPPDTQRKTQPPLMCYLCQDPIFLQASMFSSGKWQVWTLDFIVLFSFHVWEFLTLIQGKTPRPHPWRFKMGSRFRLGLGPWSVST